MLGWLVCVYRQADLGRSPATMTSKMGGQLAKWQTGLYGLDWLDKLVEEGKAMVLGGDGYPVRYTAAARHILLVIASGPPNARKNWVVDEGDVIIPEIWKGKTDINQTEMDKCDPDEWLLIETWDES